MSRNFYFNQVEPIRFAVQPDLLEQPTYVAPNYEPCLFQVTLDGSVLYQDAVSVLQDVESNIRILGQSVVQSLVNQLRPMQPESQDNLTDEQRFDMTISRYCQTIAERQAVLDYLSREHADLVAQFNAEMTQQPATDSSVSAPAEPV